MIGKVTVKSFRAKCSTQCRRWCPRCKKNARHERVDYGKGGIVLFCECGDVREVRGTKPPSGGKE